MTKKRIEKRYTFKVYPNRMSREAYRVFSIDGRDNLDDLCHMILNLFDFSWEHMYEFTLTGKLYRDDNFVCDGEGEFSTDQTVINQLGLWKGSKFWFHYDFGDDWVFVISVQKVEETDLYEKPLFIRGKGSVEQYPEWEEYQEWNEDEEWDEDV